MALGGKSSGWALPATGGLVAGVLLVFLGFGTPQGGCGMDMEEGSQLGTASLGTTLEGTVKNFRDQFIHLADLGVPQDLIDQLYSTLDEILENEADREEEKREEEERKREDADNVAMELEDEYSDLNYRGDELLSRFEMDVVDTLESALDSGSEILEEIGALQDEVYDLKKGVTEAKSSEEYIDQNELDDLLGELGTLEKLMEGVAEDIEDILANNEGTEYVSTGGGGTSTSHGGDMGTSHGGGDTVSSTTTTTTTTSTKKERKQKETETDKLEWHGADACIKATLPSKGRCAALGSWGNAVLYVKNGKYDGWWAYRQGFRSTCDTLGYAQDPNKWNCNEGSRRGYNCWFNHHKDGRRDFAYCKDGVNYFSCSCGKK